MADPKLHVIATPIGHRDDITLRALECLKRLPVFFAEDTREFKKLLELYGIASSTRVHSYAAHNMKEATEKALECLKQGLDVGLVSDRGTPAISDPGAILVRRALEEGFGVVPIPGASSLTTAVSVAGFEGNRFLFLGFLPMQGKERAELLGRAKALSLPFCIFEAPQRVRATVRELGGLFPAGEIFLGRELTKHFESLSRFPLSEIDPESIPERGEFVLLINPGESLEIPAGALETAIQLRTCSEKEWAKSLAPELKMPSSDIYNALQETKRKK